MKCCPVCGNVVPQGHGYKSTQKYCSLKCYKNRVFHGKHGEIMELLNKTNSVRITANLIGVDKATLYAYIKRNRIKRKVEWVVGL